MSALKHKETMRNPYNNLLFWIVAKWVIIWLVGKALESYFDSVIDKTEPS